MLKVNSSRNPDRHVLLNVHDLALLQATEGKISYRYRETEHIDGYFPSISASDALSGDIDIKQAYLKNNGSQVSTGGYVRFKNQGGVDVEYFEGSLDDETWSSRIELPDIATGEVVAFSVRRVIAGGQSVAIDGYKAWQTFYVGDSRYSGGYEFYITYQVGIAIREMDFREYNVKYRCMIEEAARALSDANIETLKQAVESKEKHILALKKEHERSLAIIRSHNHKKNELLELINDQKRSFDNVQVESECADEPVDAAYIEWLRNNDTRSRSDSERRSLGEDNAANRISG